MENERKLLLGGCGGSEQSEMKRRNTRNRARAKKGAKQESLELKNKCFFGWAAGGDDVESHEAMEHAKCDATRKGRRSHLFLSHTYLYNLAIPYICMHTYIFSIFHTHRLRESSLFNKLHIYLCFLH